jgi:hypothetical protein
MMDCRRPSGVTVVLMLAVLVLLPHLNAAGQEVVVKNDSVADFSQVAIQAGFISREKAAAWLTTPCQGNIVKLQIYWLSVSGATGGSLEWSLEIFQAGSFPTPGTRLVELLGPWMVDGVLNEFTLTVPIAVEQNETFVVSFEFENTPNPFLGPSVVTDIDGCQAGKNGIFAIPGGWINSCEVPLSGDFVIRAVVDCEGAVDTIFSDGFESGDTSAWTTAEPPP